MAIHNPYFRICRPFVDMEYFRNVDNVYLLDPRYAPDRIDLVRGYHLLENGLLNIFDYIEPTDSNRACFSMNSILAFDPHHIVSWNSDDDDGISHEFSVMHVKPPTTWTSAECYDFDWTSLQQGPAPFQQYAF
jgi:hypothetical protein